ncbi:MAG: hypothetical protein CL477_12525 [Acidobacteria bacterium]|jgi:uncharacterized protein (TIRG00374 family)|nr:hypothetical protein [Acidobacteriota bacterium]
MQMIGRLVTSFWFRAGLSATILAILVSQLDQRGAMRALVGVDLRYLFGAIVVDAAARATMIARWALLIRSSGAPISDWSVARIFLITSFVGTALPAGGADVTRAYSLARHTANGREAIASVAVDRLLGVSALLTLGIVGLTLGTPDAELPLARLVAGLSLATAAALCVSFWADRLLRLALPKRLQRTPLGQWLVRVADGIGAYRGRRRTLASVFCLSLLVQWLRIIGVFLLGTGLGLGVGLGYYLIFMPIALLVFMLPLSIAGIGLPQGAIVWLLGQIGVPYASSFALSTLVVAVGMLGTLPGLWLYLSSRGKEMHAGRSIGAR